MQIHDLLIQTILENPATTTKKLLELINKFSDFAGQKITIEEIAVFLYTNPELPESEIKNFFPDLLFRELEISFTLCSN